MITDFEQLRLSRYSLKEDIQHSNILCAEILNLSLAPATCSMGKREEWSKLHMMIEDWQSHLARCFQPLLSINSLKAVDFGDISTSFPVVIYTNRSTFYTAFLFHLSCLLLLQSRPHSLRRMKSTCLRNIVYHSVYLCGISKSNRLGWSHDPLVLAALLRAGTVLSYRGQQMEMLQHLNALTGLTGWKTSKEMDRLQEYWRVGQSSFQSLTKGGLTSCSRIKWLEGSSDLRRRRLSWKACRRRRSRLKKHGAVRLWKNEGEKTIV